MAAIGDAQRNKQLDVVGLFPTPIAHVAAALPPELVDALVAQGRRDANETNVHSPKLSHTKSADAATGGEAMRRAASAVAPHVAAFGELLFGERLDWSIKEMWINVLETGGFQAMHNHANSFVSGVVYLTPHHPGAGTVFHRALGGAQFSFVNEGKNVRHGPFNAPRWQTQPAQPGDLLLFPSYMMHEVPPNEGPQRITLALNALPDRLDSWGYQVRFR